MSHSNEGSLIKTGEGPSRLRWATNAIQAYYDYSEIDNRLIGMLVSIRAVEVEESGHVGVDSREVLESL